MTLALTVALNSNINKSLIQNLNISLIPLPDEKILDLSKLKEIADDILK